MLVAGTDETIARIGPAGDWYDSILDDRQGSTVALSRKDKVSSTTYAYGPYGETTSAGAASNNATQYTGRENDGDGLYFYRARYYSPKYGRFLSQDPAGLAGGINPYAYVNNSPLTATDPTGETPALIGACAGGAAISGGMDIVSRALSGRKFNASHALGVAVNGCAMGMATMGLKPGSGGAAKAERAIGSTSVSQSAAESQSFSTMITTPIVKSPKLQNIIIDLYRGTGAHDRVVTGTTADAVRHELASGVSAGEKLYAEKARSYARGLQRWLRSNPNADQRDQLVARSLLDDLTRALKGE